MKKARIKAVLLSSHQLIRPDMCLFMWIDLQRVNLNGKRCNE
jgi:hypothetical protein